MDTAEIPGFNVICYNSTRHATPDTRSPFAGTPARRGSAAASVARAGGNRTTVAQVAAGAKSSAADAQARSADVAGAVPRVCRRSSLLLAGIANSIRRPADHDLRLIRSRREGWRRAARPGRRFEWRLVHGVSRPRRPES